MVAVTADKVVVELEARLSKYNADVAGARQNFDRSVAGMASSAENAERRITRASSGIKQALLASTSTLAAGLSGRAVVGLADSYTRFTNQLKLAGLEGQALTRTQDALFVSAQKYGVELEGLGTLYGRVSQAGKELGATNEDLLKLTNGVAAAIKVQGAAAPQVAGALLQLSQALGGVNVRAEEYNSINDGARPILQAVANGSDRFKGSVNALRAAVIEGKVSSREFYEAFLKGSGQLEAQATKSNLTIAASLTTLNNALGFYIGRSDDSLSATERAAAGIALLAENINLIVPALGVLIGLVGARYLAVAIANTAATVANADAHAFRTAMLRAEAAAEAQMTPFTNASTAALLRQNAAVAANAGRLTGAAGAASRFGTGLLALAGGPVGIAIIAVAALAAAVFYLDKQYNQANIRQRELDASAKGAADALDAYEGAAIKAATATGENARQATANAAAMRQEAIDAIRSAQALRERTAALAAEAATLARSAADEATRPRARDPGEVAGSLATAAGLEGAATRAEAQAAQAVADLDKAKARLAEIEQNLKTGAYNPAPVIAAADTKGGKGRSAEDEAEELRRIEQRFADDIRDANRRLLDARTALATAEEDLLANELRRIRQTRDDAVTEAERMGPAGTKELTAERVLQLQALANVTASIEEQNAIQQTANKLTRDAVEAEQARFDTANDYLDLTRELERTSAGRLEVERQIMELQFAQERAQLAATIASQDISDVERRIAEERLAFLPRLQAAQREVLRQANLSPLQRIGGAERGPDAIGAQERRETVEGIAAAELSNLGAALAKATFELDGFGDAILQTGQAILENVLAEVYNSIIVAPLADLVSQGLDALFGTAATNVKTSADASAAVAAQALSAAGSSAAIAMATTTVAANALSAALTAAAASAATGSGGGGAADIIGSILGAAQGSGGARAYGGSVVPGLAYTVGENGRETFVPESAGMIVPNQKFAAAEAKERRGSGAVQIINNTGVAAVPLVERDDQGNQKITLEPFGEKMIEGAGSSGKLKRALQKSPNVKKRA